MAFDVAAARAAGYSDQEIAEYLGSQNKFDTGAALRAGYTPEEIIGHLGGGKPPKESGVLSELRRGIEQPISSAITGVKSIFGTPEEEAIKGVQRGREISERAGEGPSLEAVKKAYERGLLPAAGEVLSQIPKALAGQAGTIGSAMAGARLGAMAGAPFGPVGAVIGGAGGAGAALLPQFLGSNIERQAAESMEKQQPVNIRMGEAAKAAAGQAALEGAGQAFMLGKGLVKGVLGLTDDVALMTAKAEQELLKKAQQSVTGAATRGAAIGATEIPVEVGQQILERWQAGLPLTNADAMKEYGESAYLAGLIGGTVGGASRVMERGAAQDKLAQRPPTAPPAITPEQPAPEAPPAEPPLQLGVSQPFTPVVFPDGTVARSPEDVRAYEEEQFRKKYEPQPVREPQQMDLFGQEDLKLRGEPAPAAPAPKTAANVQEAVDMLAAQERADQRQAEAGRKELEAAGQQRLGLRRTPEGEPTTTGRPEPTTTAEDVMLTAIPLPKGVQKWVENNVWGRTRTQLQDLVTRQPDLAKGPSPRARLLRVLTAPEVPAFQETRREPTPTPQPAAEPTTGLGRDQQGLEVPSEPARPGDVGGVPAAPGRPARPVRRRLAPVEQPVDEGRAPQVPERGALNEPSPAVVPATGVAPVVPEAAPETAAPVKVEQPAPAGTFEALAQSVAGKETLPEEAPAPETKPKSPFDWRGQPSEFGLQLQKEADERRSTATRPGQTLAALKQEISAGKGIAAAALRRMVQSGKVVLEEKHPSGERIGGLFDGKKVTLYADGIPAGEAMAVAMHEVAAHMGMRKLLGDAQYNAIIDRILAMASDKANSQERALAQRALGRIPGADIEKGPDVARDEAVAYYVEELAKAEASGELPKAGPLRNLWNRVKTAIVTAINRALGTKFGISDFTAQDIGAIAHAAFVKESTTGVAEQAPVKEQFSVSYSTEQLIDSMGDLDPQRKSALRSILDGFQNQKDLSLGVKFRTQVADIAASIERRLHERFNGAVRDSLGNLNPMGLYRQAQDYTKMLLEYFQQGSLVKDKSTGLWKVTTAGDVNAPSRVYDLLDAWGKKNGYSFDRATQIASRILEGVRLNEMRESNRTQGTEFLLHLTDAQIDQLVAEYRADPDLQALSDSMDAPRKALVDKMVEAGRLSPEMGKQWKDVIGYVPFDRIDDFESKFSKVKKVSGRGIAQLGKLPELVGSKERPVGNVFDNYLNTLGWMVGQTLKNDASVQTLRALEDLGQAKFLGNTPQFKDNTASAYVNGEQKFWELPSKYDVMAFKDLTPPKSGYLKLLGQASNILRTTVTALPPFALKQVVDDIQRAILTSGVKSPTAIVWRSLTNFPKLAIAELRGIRHPIVKDAEALGFSGAFDFVQGKPAAYLLADMGYKPRGWIKEALHRLEGITRASDLAVRKAIYDQTVKEGGDALLAQTRAREFINFRRRGASDFVGAMVTTIPFFNAYVQGMDVLYRAASGIDSSSSVTRAQARKLFWNRAAMVTALSTLYALGKDDDDEQYKEADLRTRDSNWFIGGQKLSVPGELGAIFKVIPERIVEYYKRQGTPEEQDAFEAMRTALTYMYEQYVGRTVPIPQAAKPLLEAWTNYSFLTGRPLEGIHQKAMLPSQRRAEATSELALAISKFSKDQIGVEVSPIMIDNTLRGYFGSTAAMITMVTDSLLNPTRVDRPLHKWALLSNYMIDPVGTRRLGEFYEEREKVGQLNTTLNDLAKTDIAAAEAFAEKHAGALAMNTYINATLEQLEQTRAYRKYLNSPDGAAEMSKAEREREIEEIRRTEVELVSWLREAKAMMRNEYR